jgi:hypothetical protein
MIDLFILLTPILLLGVVALLGFAGCTFHANEDVETFIISPTFGVATGGTAVTITGAYAGFQSNASVLFGESASDVAVPGTIVGGPPSATITAVTPAHTAGFVDVKLSYNTEDGDSHQDLLSSGFDFYDPVALVGAALPPPKVNVKVQTASLPAIPGSKLVVVTVVWGTNAGNAPPTLTAPGVTFTQIGTTDPLGLEFVATFFAVADLTSGITVTATLNVASTQDFDVLISAYDHADPVPSGPFSTRGVGNGMAPGTTAPLLPFTISGLLPGDLIYAIAIAGNAVDKLSGFWNPGLNLIAAAGQNGYLMLEFRVVRQSDLDAAATAVPAGTFPITATDEAATNPPNASRWYLFAMAIKHG